VTLRVLLVLLLLGTLAACLRPRPSWTLVEPPEVRNENFPRGYQLLPTAPLDEWHRVATFASEAACEAARKGRLDDAIDRARAAVGDDARYDLDVRRAVNSRCVTGAR
jgi:hypothetical protein